MESEIKATQERKLFQWDSLRRFADNRVAKLTVIIPIAGYLLLFNDQIIGNLSFETIAGSEPGFFFTTDIKLKFMFFGSLALLIANALFNTRSPKILTGSPDDIAFSERVISAYTIAEIIGLQNHLLEQKYVLRTSLAADLNKSSARYKLSQKTITKRLTNPNSSRSKFMANRIEFVRFMAREYWADQMHSNKCARYFCLFFALFGYFMLGLSSLDLVQAVIRDLFA